MERFEFISDGWLGALECAAQHLLDESGAQPGKPVSYIEIFSDVPSDRQTGAVTGYVLSFADGKASVTRAQGEDEPGDCRVRVDYGVALATMQFRSGPELAALGGKAFADGSMTMIGSPKDLPISMNSLHDILIDQTVAAGDVTA